MISPKMALYRYLVVWR